MALKKMCPKCGALIFIGQKYCDDCMKRFGQDKKDNDKYYDKMLRDKESRQFYNSKEWNIIRQRVKERDANLCQVCLFNHRITEADVVHHIEEIKEAQGKRLDATNCICLCNACHNSVHAKYKTDKANEQYILYN
ncbi:MAG: HNH endonuclease, partial [Sarcina sp.]